MKREQRHSNYRLQSSTWIQVMYLFPLLITAYLATCVCVCAHELHPSHCFIIIALLRASHSSQAIIAGLTCTDGCLRAAGHNSDIVSAILGSQYEPGACWFNYTIILGHDCTAFPGEEYKSYGFIVTKPMQTMSEKALWVGTGCKLMCNNAYYIKSIKACSIEFWQREGNEWKVITAHK